jgi:hypothetical protein
MKRALFFFAALLISWEASADTADQYALQVLKKDLPLSLRWFGKAAQSEQLDSVEVYSLYQSALPEAQVNKQLGISTKDSVDRMLILLDGARNFEQVQKAPVDFQNKKEIVNRALQVTKDGLDRFQYGEDPQNLIEEWRVQGFQLYGRDFSKFVSDLVETFSEVQRLLSSPVTVVATVAAEQKEDVSEEAVENQPEVEMLTSLPIDENAGDEDSFEVQRLKSYIGSAETGTVAGECQNALVWKTDQAESCQSDESLECDRSYARQCKKLQ